MSFKYIGMLLVIIMLLCPCAHARDFEYGDTDTLGNIDWFVDSDGNIVPSVDGTQTIGESGNELGAVYSDTIASAQLNVGIDGGSADHYYASMTPGITAYATGTIVIFRADAANTGACDLDVNGIGVTSLKMLNNQDPASSYIEAGSMVMAVYDFTDDVFELISPDANP